MTHDSIQDSLPTLILVILYGLQEHFLVFGNGHLFIDEELVACLIVWLEGKALREGGIHGVDIDVH